MHDEVLDCIVHIQYCNIRLMVYCYVFFMLGCLFSLQVKRMIDSTPCKFVSWVHLNFI